MTSRPGHPARAAGLAALMGRLTDEKRELAARWWPLACQVASRCAGDRDDRADAAADGLLEAAAECTDPRWMAWLVRLRVVGAAGKARAARRAGRRRPDRPMLPVGAAYFDGRINRSARCDPPDPRDHARAADDRDEAAALLGRLTPADRSLVAALAAGASQRQAAARLGISQALVVRRLGRIRSQLRPPEEP